MFGWCRILKFTIIQFFFKTTISIIVEKNYFLYYKLPTDITSENLAENFFLLQCPYRSTIEIPLLKDMSACRIIARYGEIKHPVLSSTPSRPRSHLHTRITYRMPNLSQRPKINNNHDMRPYLHKVIIRPMMSDMPAATMAAVSSVMPLAMTNEFLRKPVPMKTEPTTMDFSFTTTSDNNLITNNTEPDEGEAQEHNNLQRFFTKHSKYKTREIKSGHRNMYYRDEIVNDHTLDTEFDQNGKYGIHGNTYKPQDAD